MPSVSWDDKAFIVNGERLWLAAGSIHYFRVPREMWRDRLLKLKRAGCNTLETYTAWNAHEPREGRFDFSDMLDLDAFFTLAESMGFWIIARPGPYICSEWENGGIPAWLNAKPGVELRVANPVYHHYVSLFFKRLIPIIAKHQVTRGGRVILVQDENEYIYRNRPGGNEHLVFLRDLLKDLGIDVPIVVCNFFREPIPDTIECWNGWENVLEGIPVLRRRQPDAPKLITELWVGCFEAWGHIPGPIVSPREVQSVTLRLTAAGAQFIYYMFHGGTNFGYYAGRTDVDRHDDHTYTASSYDYDAPLPETGAVAEKYYYTKLGATLASSLSRFFAESEAVRLNVAAPAGVEVIARSSSQGHVIFVTRLDPRIERAKLSLPGRVALEVSFADADSLALPWRFSPAPGLTVDYSNLSIVGMMPTRGGRMLFLHGPSRSDAVLSVNGAQLRRAVADGAQVWFGNDPNLVAVLDTEAAKRAWFLDDRTVVGPDFVGETNGDKTEAFFRAKAQPAVTYFSDGRTTYASSSGAPRLPRPPRLSRWTRRPLFPSSRPDNALRIDDGSGGFRALEPAGYFGGYGWYETSVASDRAGTETLLFADAEDRLTVFAGGRRSGTFGRGAGASMGLVKVPLKHGANTLTVLLDNLGRTNFTEAIGEVKGIRAPVYLGARKLAAKASWSAPRGTQRVAGHWMLDSFFPKNRSVAAVLSCAFNPRPGEGIVLRIQNVKEPADVYLNGRLLTRFWGRRVICKYDVTLPPGRLAAGLNLLELRFLVDPGRPPRPAVENAVSLYAFDPSRVLAGPWWFWQSEAPVAPRGKAVPSGPVAWETTFDLDKPEVPIFFVPDGMKKGEVWLNGRMVSRYWDVGPQKRVYLPEPWLTGTNTLVVLDEFGASPRAVRLEYDSRALLSREML